MIGDDLGLVGARAIHFAATALTAGGTLFWFLIAKPAFAAAGAGGAGIARAYRRKLVRIIGAALAVCALSGLAWLLLLAAASAVAPFRVHPVCDRSRPIFSA